MRAAVLLNLVFRASKSNQSPLHRDDGEKKKKTWKIKTGFLDSYLVSAVASEVFPTVKKGHTGFIFSQREPPKSDFWVH